MGTNCMSLPPPADGLVNRWGSCTSSHCRSLQLFRLSLRKHREVERCGACFYRVLTCVLIQCAERSKGITAGTGLAVPEHPGPFCPAVVDTNKAAAKQCFV